MILSEQFERAGNVGRFGRLPHISVWYSENHGWLASCGGVGCERNIRHPTPEAALVNAFDQAIALAEQQSHIAHPNTKVKLK